MVDSQLASNPFALLLDPQAVMAVIERSERLARLQSRVCRPLDKPLIAHASANGDDADDADASTDGASDDTDSAAD